MAHNKHTNKRKAARLFYRALQYSLACCLCSIGIAAEAAEFEIEEIVVTATKRSAALSDIASSISVVDADTLDKRSISDLEDLQGMIPNFNFRQLHGNRFVTIRGIGGNIDTGQVEVGVASHIDGVYMARADMLAIDSHDLERIEVLRGPQGTLYGKNATGGTINFITKAPTDEFEARIGVGGGDYGATRGNIMVSGPLTDSVQARFSAFYSDFDGYSENIYTGNDVGGEEKFGVRGRVTIHLNDGWTIDATAFHQEADIVGPVVQVFDNSSSQIFDALQLFFGPTILITDEHLKISSFTDPFNEIETTGGILRIDGGWGSNIQFTSLTGAFDHSYGPQQVSFGGVVSGGFFALGQSTSFGYLGRGSLFPEDPRFRQQDSDTFSQEFNLLGTAMDGKLEWLVGLYYYEEDYSFQIPFIFVNPNVQVMFGGGFVAANPILFPPGTGFIGSNLFMDEETESRSIFFDLTYSLTDRLRLNLGGRYGEDEKKAVQHLADYINLPPGSPLQPAGGTLRLPSCPPGNILKLDDTKFSPKVRLERDFGDNLGYVQYQQSNKPGQMNAALCNDIVAQEEIEAFEIGYKGTSSDGSFTWSTAAFFYIYDNYQSLELTVDGTASFLTNIPEAEYLGVEVELVYKPTSNFSIDFAATWLDSEITKGSEEIGVDTFDPGKGIQDLEGNSLPSTPEFTFRVGLNYDQEIGDIGFSTRLDYTWVDEQAYRAFGVREVHPEDGQGSYGLANLFATLRFSNGKYVVRGFVRNLGDEEYKNWTLFTPIDGFNGSVAPPRFWGVDLTANF